MKLLAIPAALLVLIFCFPGCDRDDLPADPWVEMYGTYIGTSEFYLPGGDPQPDDSLRNWVLLDKLQPDTIRIIAGESTGSVQKTPGCITVEWHGGCSLEGLCPETGPSGAMKLQLDLRAYWLTSTKYKSNLSILFIPEGEIYPGSDYALSPHSESRVTGFRIADGDLYMFYFAGTGADEAPGSILIFSGRKISPAPDIFFHAGSARSFYCEDEHYERNISP
jgi:hypothetical protein